MTFVGTLVAGRVVVQTGDRLLSRGGQRWDPLANKTVVLLGVDGSATISYSGLAYIGQKPTDQWIAEAVSERDPVFAGRLATRHDSTLRPRIGLALANLRDAIERDFASLPRRDRISGLHIAVGGFVSHRRRRPSGRPRPFAHVYVHRGQDGDELDVGETPRYWDWRIPLVGPIPIGVSTGGAWDVFRSQLFQPPAKPYDECERLLVDCVRSVSAVSPSAVGADSMSVIHPRPLSRRAGDVLS